ncbi:hypothetical protein A3D84_03425 [Candidatus Woesebacteria bacterium RIFCSPHIGHO2_02_FULL_42_20]|uniref:Uncharacterized protein n=1 Tax=Candidatus Woesebacteria bacterium RIFCSPHIGHO2_12_FULL_41_24 TaxID=1802510 RepID=A0A1F8ATY4_9BACT|nr:MAG: hypothetical protein A2W15_03575 [Candidatus Woesebacteria bacterium RBG_16_41_13]OGM29608.1 MAG: hypothetical protein A2873_03600 [Candidatus Woesebacteria bacterium RIFCSPHIGHO2_01_FULL_42_80]OGM35584.1 MAG: hypothetical protein A3D84_03425 [Candidatus Woesebacteria bacterium RIFCSPHIGHO2_02_FULL_42_20]OGM55196.1 MAG: hypothetical protein A3E44_02835 [Candidatus Woesebacteria bacterium RIFCSPHIGHO2_12_FULL_41_24]OGM67150.1 MAG: hypothetical protein A2969_04560 [Candidatus Woesebacteri
MTEEASSQELVLINERDRELKRIEYAGFGGTTGEVVYQIQDGRVIFSATRGSRDATSTINAAESVIAAICNAEGIDWRDPSRRDNPITMLINQHLRLEDIQIDELKLRPDGDSIYVELWTPVDIKGRPLSPVIAPPSGE